MFYTMNANETYYKENMEQGLKSRTDLLKLLGGTVEVYAACDTYQFSDYNKFHAGIFDEEHKRKVQEEQFPKDLQAAFEIGCSLVSGLRLSFLAWNFDLIWIMPT